MSFTSSLHKKMSFFVEHKEDKDFIIKKYSNPMKLTMDVNYIADLNAMCLCNANSPSFCILSIRGVKNINPILFISILRYNLCEY